MLGQSIVLYNSSFIAGSNIAASVQWPGGRTAAVVTALAYPASALTLQTQGYQSVVSPPSGGGWIDVASSFVSDQVFAFDAPRGNYRLVNKSTSSVIGINAVLVTIPYY